MASFLTFLSSAIWHGYYLTYYLTFGLLYFYQSGSYVFDKLGFYDWIRKTKFLIPIASIFNGLAFETIGIFFFNLKWDKALIGARNMKYYPIISIMGLYFLSRMYKIPKEKKPKNKNDDKLENKKIE